MPNLEDILAVILGGGRGARLYPLTKLRSKPAVPIAGKYRLIDIPISNCINSGIYHIAVLTQFNSVSLHRHLTNTYQFDHFHAGYVQVWAAAEQTLSGSDWYQGTADAVRKQLFEIKATRTSYVLILAGDHLYRMDYAAMADFHKEKKAEITVAVQPVLASDAKALGILKVGANRAITKFAEKPKDPEVLAELVSRDDPVRPYLGSMGIYLFNTDVLIDLLENFAFDDFGNHVIPHAINKHAVFGFDFDDYWVDVGTIRSFYDTNLGLARPNPKFNFFDPQRPIYSRPRYLPCSTVTNSVLQDVMMAEGCSIENAEIHHSVIGLRSQICSGVKIIDTVMMGSDYYDTVRIDEPAGTDVPLGIGRDSHIEGAIIDKNARLGARVVIRPFPRGIDYDGGNWVVRDGIVVIPKNTIIPTGTVISPENTGDLIKI
jgi:glucose-1-phosphate adenylyltransferase